jgi:hypothetical protein
MAKKHLAFMNFMFIFWSALQLVVQDVMHKQQALLSKLAVAQSGGKLQRQKQDGRNGRKVAASKHSSAVADVKDQARKYLPATQDTSW